MSEIEVRIEKLAPMRVARFHAFGTGPEQAAWKKLLKWAEPISLLEDTTAHPVFGFNNPSPKKAGEEYGYEFWIRIDDETPLESGIKTLDFPGGWYAVTTVRRFPNPDIWIQLFQWVRNSPYEHRRTHELERPHDPLASESDLQFDLYLPVDDSHVILRPT